MGTTALVNEMYVKLREKANIDFHDKTRVQFYGFCRVAMHHLLVDYLRKSSKQNKNISFEDCGWENDRWLQDVDFDNSKLNSIEKKIMVDQALSKIENGHPRKVDVFILKYEFGFTEREVADILGVSVTSVKRDSSVALSMLELEIKAKNQHLV
jgi:RNA polymerase sigma factor (sigma-70 family)